MSRLHLEGNAQHWQEGAGTEPVLTSELTGSRGKSGWEGPGWEGARHTGFYNGRTVLHPPPTVHESSDHSTASPILVLSDFFDSSHLHECGISV